MTLSQRAVKTMTLLQRAVTITTLLSHLAVIALWSKLFFHSTIVSKVGKSYKATHAINMTLIYQSNNITLVNLPKDRRIYVAAHTSNEM